MSFEKFKFLESFNYEKGWDKYALDYVNLLRPDTVYSLTKELMYKLVDEYLVLDDTSEVLDMGCGTGNDFPFFISKGAFITAFDMSRGMLNKSDETYRNEVGVGRIELYHGHLEHLNSDSFNFKKFDLIYAITGSLSYIDNTELLRVFKVLKTMLKPNGRIITAHLNRHCLSEQFYNWIRLKFSRITQRNGTEIKVQIKEEEMIMYLRTASQLEVLFSDEFRHVKSYPLLVLTPPYQTGFNPGKFAVRIFKKVEMKMLKKSKFTRISDQFVIVLSDEE